jgi:hypothetical protein
VPETVVETPIEAVSEPASETPPETEHMVDLSDYTTPEYLEMVKKLIAPNETDAKETSKKFKIPGYTSIQMSNTSKQPRRKSMTFV